MIKGIFIGILIGVVAVLVIDFGFDSSDEELERREAIIESKRDSLRVLRNEMIIQRDSLSFVYEVRTDSINEAYSKKLVSIKNKPVKEKIKFINKYVDRGNEGLIALSDTLDTREAKIEVISGLLRNCEVERNDLRIENSVLIKRSLERDTLDIQDNILKKDLKRKARKGFFKRKGVIIVVGVLTFGLGFLLGND